MKRYIGLILLVCLLVSGLSAQAKTALTIQSNVNGARVYIEDKLAGYTNPNFSVLLLPGTYKVRVSMDGYPDFSTTVVLGNTPVTIIATLGNTPVPPAPPPPPPPPRAHLLQIQSNVAGAQVYINGSYAGTVPFAVSYPAGSYQIEVRAPGYDSYFRTVQLTGPVSFFASLLRATFPVSINLNNNIRAAVYIDDSYVGQTPYYGFLSPGSYTIRISATGYRDYVERIRVNGPMTLQIVLQPALVEYEVRLPQSFMDMFGRKLDMKDFDIYIDNKYQKSLRGVLEPGTHTLAIEFRNFRFETQFEVRLGNPVVIEPFFGVMVR